MIHIDSQNENHKMMVPLSFECINHITNNTGLTIDIFSDSFTSLSGFIAYYMSEYVSDYISKTCF